MKLTCNECKRKIRDSFIDKLTHMVQYHPEKIVAGLPMLANISRNFGEQLGEKAKGVLTNAKP